MFFCKYNIENFFNINNNYRQFIDVQYSHSLLAQADTGHHQVHCNFTMYEFYWKIVPGFSSISRGRKTLQFEGGLEVLRALPLPLFFGLKHRGIAVYLVQIMSAMLQGAHESFCRGTPYILVTSLPGLSNPGCQVT